MATLTTYVVELTPEVLKSRKFRDANPQGADKACLYVGSTAHSAEHRFAQHMAGEKSNRGWVTKYGTQLRQDLASDDTYATRKEAEDAEAALAAHLRSLGYQVWQR